MAPWGFSSNAEDVAKACAQNIKGRTFLVTGVSEKGIGAYVAVTLAREQPERIILVSRNKAKVDPVIEEVKAAAGGGAGVQVTFVQCELSDFDSVRQAAKTINEDSGIAKIDVVINNAGVMALNEYALDKQGNELQLSSNHLGHFLLTNSILPKILAAAPGARIVNVSSLGHGIGPFRFDDYNFSGGKAYDRWSGYGQSKTANVLYSVALTEKLSQRGVVSLSAHPGTIWGTGLATHLEPQDFAEITEVMKRNNGEDATWEMDAKKTIAQGAAPLVAAAVEPDLASHGGAYIVDCQPGNPQKYAVDPENARRLWTLSEELVGQKFDV